MAVLLKGVSLLAVSLLLGLLLRKTVPEQALLLNIAAVTVVLLSAAEYAFAFRELIDLVRSHLKTGNELTVPIVKCVLVGILARLGVGFCKDASQNAAASAVELLGTVTAMSIAMPLIIRVLKTIGDFL